jgi:hypothetical protein
LLASARPEDVVYVPLYRGSEEDPGPFPPEPLSDYGKRVAFLREIAPRVQGIITGNHGPELSYKHLGWTSEQNCARMAGFVELTAPRIVAAGGRPVYGTIDWDLLHDVYSGGQELLGKAVAKYNGWQIVFTGFTLVPDTYMQPEVKHFQGDQLRRMRGPDPSLAVVRSYLARYEVWSGMGGQAGLAAGNAEKLEQFGFRGSICSG